MAAKKKTVKKHKPDRRTKKAKKPNSKPFKPSGRAMPQGYPSLGRIKLGVRICGQSACKFGQLTNVERFEVKGLLLNEAVARLANKVKKNLLSAKSECKFNVDKNGHLDQDLVRDVMLVELGFNTNGTDGLPDPEPDCYEYTVYDGKICCIKCYVLVHPHTGSPMVSAASSLGPVFASAEMFVEWCLDQGGIIK